MSGAAATRWHSLRATVGGRKQRRTLPRNSLKSPQLHEDGWSGGIRRSAVQAGGIKGATICRWYIAGGFTRHCTSLKAWMNKLFSMACSRVCCNENTFDHAFHFKNFQYQMNDVSKTLLLPGIPFGVSGVCGVGDLMMEGCNYSSLYTYHACMHHTHKLLYSLTNVIYIHIIQSYVLSLLFSLYVMCADKPCIVQLMTRLLYATCIRWI